MKCLIFLYFHIRGIFIVNVCQSAIKHDGFINWYFVHHITINDTLFIILLWTSAVCLQIMTKGQTFLAFEERINLRTSHLVGLLFLSHFSRSQKYAVMNRSNSRVSKATSSRGGGGGRELSSRSNHLYFLLSV